MIFSSIASAITSRSRVAERPLRGAVWIGLALAPASLVLTGLMLAGASLLLPRSEWGASAAASMAGLSGAVLFIGAILFAPALETVLGQVLPIEAVRRLGGGRAVCILASAAVFGAGHCLNGGWVHGAVSFAASSVFASAYVVARPFGFWAASAAAATAHATHNFMLLYVVAGVFPQWA